MEVIKRDGKKVPFQKEKIAKAIEAAMHSASGIYQEGVAEKIANEIEEYAENLGHSMTIYSIEDQVYYKLLENDNPATARSYENYKAMQAFKRHILTKKPTKRTRNLRKAEYLTTTEGKTMKKLIPYK